MREIHSKRVQSVERSPFYVIGDYARKMGFKDMIYLNLGEPDFETPKHIREAAKRALDEGYTHYTGDKGYYDLRAAIAEHLKQTRGIDVDPEDGVFVTSGGAEGNWCALMGTVNPGDEVLVASPLYPGHKIQIGLVGGVPVRVPLDEKRGFIWTKEDIEKKITKKTKAILFCSPNNPTGGVLTEQCLKELAEIAEEHDLVVISDEVYYTLTYGSTKFASISSIPGMLERTIITNSFSKAYAMTGWRVGYLAGDPEVVKGLLRVHYASTINAPSIAQRAALAALTESQDCIAKMREAYAKRREKLVKGLNKIGGVRCTAPNGAFYAFPDISEFGMSSWEFVKYLIREAHVVTSPGGGFGVDWDGYIRISYANSIENIERALERITTALSKLRR
ncbi:pyridoxal phosphate-dependent aminotransferase [Candidatus Bathyarchaeota archaeon]|nr:pyridoxal phosphate-dependent aminotransferase [Candidatus Bathyarchaeota archaeon]